MNIVKLLVPAAFLGFGMILGVHLEHSRGEQRQQAAVALAIEVAYAEGVQDAPRPFPVPPVCDVHTAALWWVGTKDMRKAKEVLCH